MADLSSYIYGLKNATVLGINPPVFDFAYFDFWAKPLGLLYILQSLRQRGNRVNLIDCIYEGRGKAKSFGRYKPRRHEVEKPLAYAGIPRRYFHFGLDEEEFLERLRGTPRPDVILVTSVMTYWYPGVFWSIDLVRRVFPDVPVILGGIYARLCPDHARLSGANEVQTEPFPLDAPWPALDLYDGPEYGISLTSLGCPLGCDYCASKELWPHFRQRSVEEVLSEMEFQAAIPSVGDFAFYDDALLVNKDSHFYPICDELRRRFPEIRFHTPNGLHVRQIDEKCANYLYGTGFSTIRLSLESTDPSIQRASSDKVSVGQYESAVRNLYRVGYDGDDIETYILVGLPGESVESVERAINFVKSLGAKVKTAQFSPIPGTVYYGKACKRVPPLKDEPLLQNNSVYCTWISGEMNPGELQDLKNLARS